MSLNKLNKLQAQKKLENFLLKAKEKNVETSRIKKDCLTIEWFQENYTTAEKTKLTLICPVHGEYQQTISQFLKGKGCRNCSNTKNSRKKKGRRGGYFPSPTFEIIQNKISHINNNFNVNYKLNFNKKQFPNIYKSYKSEFEVICFSHGIFKTSWNKLRDNRLCPNCNTERKYLNYKKFLKSYEKYFRKKEFDYSLITKEWYENERQNSDGPTFNIKIPIIHKNCNNIFYQTIGNHFHLNQGCPYCDPSRKFELKDIKKIAKKFIIGSKKLNQNIKLISKLNHDWIKNYKGYHKTKLIFKCKKHGIFSKNPGDIKNNNQCGCPICNTETRQSKGERKIGEILNQLNLKFKQEVKVFNTRLRFDFFLKEYNLAIEFDGQQHFHNLDFRGRNLKKIKKNDFLKNKLCFIYKINLIRIPYWEYDNLEEYLVRFLNRERVIERL